MNSQEIAILEIDKYPVEWVELKGEDLIVDSIFRPTDLYIKDSILILPELNNDKLLSIYNLSSKSFLFQGINKGTGSDEMISIKILDINDNLLEVMDVSQFKIITFKIDLNNSRLNGVRERRFNLENKYFQEPKLLAENKLISPVLSESNARIVAYDLSTNTDSTIFEMVFTPKEGVSLNIHSQAYHPLFDIKPDKSKLVCLGKNSDLFEIYNLNAHTAKLVRTHGKIDPVFDIVNHGGAEVMSWTMEMPFCYSSLTVNDEYIFALYSGNRLKDGGDAHFTKMLYIFDWDGKLKYKFLLEYPSNEIEIVNDNILVSLERSGHKDLIRKYELPIDFDHERQ